MSKTQPADQPTAQSSLLQRVGQVFWAPVQLFRELGGTPRWGGALLVVLALETFAAWAIPEAALQAQAAATQGLEVEALETLRYLVPPFTAIVAVLLAGLILLVGNVALGGKASFTEAMSVTSHSLLVYGVGSAVVLPLMYATGQMEVGLTLNLLVPGLEEGFWFQLLQGLDVFALWTALLLGWGAERICFDRHRGRLAVFFVAGWLGLALVGALLAG